MKDVIDTHGDVGHRVDISDVRLVEREVIDHVEGFEVLFATSCKVVDATDVVAATKESVGEVQPYETCDTGDECGRHTTRFSTGWT